MAKRAYVVRANFPTQSTDLIENVQATGWTAALGMAARAMKKRLPGRRIKAASFTIEQVEFPATQLSEQAAAQATLPEVVATPEPPVQQVGAQGPKVATLGPGITIAKL